jgi:hypothetical protein
MVNTERRRDYVPRAGEQQLMSLIIVVLLGVSAALGGMVWSLTTDYSRHMAVIASDVAALQVKLNAHIRAHQPPGIADAADPGKAGMP